MALVAGSNASMSAKLRRPTRTPTTAKPSRSAAVHASRRDLGLQMLTFGAGLLGFAGAAFATDEGASKPAGDSTASSSSSSSSGGFITITPINGAAKSYMDMRDNAMEFQCSGGMFDCDGDRREFAHKQYMDWLNSGGVPKRIREGKPEGPKSY